MRKISLMVLLCCVPGRLWAGNLDLDYIKPSPTKALMYSEVFPGGGFFYLSGTTKSPDKWYQARGILYLVVTSAIIASTASQMRIGSEVGTALGVAAFVAVRVVEFGDVIDAAEQDRYAAAKKREL